MAWIRDFSESTEEVLYLSNVVKEGVAGLATDWRLGVNSAGFLDIDRVKEDVIIMKEEEAVGEKTRSSFCTAT